MTFALTPPVRAVRQAWKRPQGTVSKEAKSAAWTLLELPVAERRATLKTLEGKELSFILSETQRITGSMYGMWIDTPSGFVEDVLGETIWSRQREILDAVALHKRVAVPAGFGVGKTHLAARSVLHFVSVHPPGTALVVTTATRFRQVRTQMWPHIRKAHARAGLPGTCDTTQYKIPDPNGVETVVAYGFTAPENDEAAMQGIHATRLLLVVDEAGGIAKTIGEGTNNLLTGDARMLATGNPAMDNPGSWFEGLCEEGWAGHVDGTVTIPIPATDSPAITGELTPICRDCVPNPDNHRIADVHMPDQSWVNRTIDAWGEDHPYVISKVHAKFPKDVGIRVIPSSWVEAAVKMPEPEGPAYVRLGDLGLEEDTRVLSSAVTVEVPGETDAHRVAMGAWVRLGVDVAADGGDEFAIYRCVGDMVHERHVSAGSANANAVTVAEKVLGHILAAERLSARLGTEAKPHIKVDVIGVGWGVVGQLQRWGRDKLHNSVIVPVNVAESPGSSDEGAAMRPYRKRDEMWLAGRLLMQPDAVSGETRIRLRVPEKCAAQFSMPSHGINGTGLTVVESKAAMRSRGKRSPDRAEAAILSWYEPGVVVRKNRGVLN